MKQLLLLLGFLLISFLHADEGPVEYMGRKIARTMHWEGAAWLIRDSREREESAAEMLKQLNVKPGQTVCDLGCGNGFHTLTLAQMVAPGGRTLAVDIQHEMLVGLNERAEAEGIKGIETILGGYTNPNIPAGEVDLLLLVDVYHEFSHPEEMLVHIRNSLAAGGRVALVEYRAEDKTVPIKPDHKMSRKQILKEWTANGFKLVGEYKELPWQHLMFFEVTE